MIEHLPPPTFSDGVAVPSIDLKEASPLVLTSFLNTLSTYMIMKLLKQPQLLSTLGLAQDTISPSAVLTGLPLNYSLYETDSIMIYGHPSGLAYTSAVDFVPHLFWLMEDPTHNSFNCQCKLCLSSKKLDTEKSSQDSRYYSMKAVAQSYKNQVKQLQKALTKAQAELEVLKQERVQIYNLLNQPFEEEDVSEFDQLERVLVLKQKKSKPPPTKRVKLTDPNAPKRPANAFMLFCDLERDNIRQERDALKGTEEESSLTNLTKALGARWRSLDETSKQKYEDLFREQVAQYDKDLKEYLKDNPQLVEEKKPVIADGAPKRPANAYFVFCEMERDNVKQEREAFVAANPSSEEAQAPFNITKALGSKWRSLTADQRKIYQDRFKKEIQAYNEYYKDRGLEPPPAPGRTRNVSSDSPLGSPKSSPKS